MKTHRAATWFGVVAVLGASVLACAHAEQQPGKAPDPRVAAELTVPAFWQAGAPLRVEVRLRNATDAPLRVLTWDTPFARVGSMLEVTGPDGRRVDYIGYCVSYEGEPDEAAYLLIPPRSAVMAEVDLARNFEITQRGEYTVQFVGRVSDLLEGAARRRRPGQRRQPALVTSLPSHVTIEAPLPPAAAPLADP